MDNQSIVDIDKKSSLLLYGQRYQIHTLKFSSGPDIHLKFLTLADTTIVNTLQKYMGLIIIV